jgi:hypothetical protein
MRGQGGWREGGNAHGLSVSQLDDGGSGGGGQALKPLTVTSHLQGLRREGCPPFQASVGRLQIGTPQGARGPPLRHPLPGKVHCFQHVQQGSSRDAKLGRAGEVR